MINQNLLMVAHQNEIHECAPRAHLFRNESGIRTPVRMDKSKNQSGV